MSRFTFVLNNLYSSKQPSFFRCSRFCIVPDFPAPFSYFIMYPHSILPSFPQKKSQPEYLSIFQLVDNLATRTSTLKISRWAQKSQLVVYFKVVVLEITNVVMIQGSRNSRQHSAFSYKLVLQILRGRSQMTSDGFNGISCRDRPGYYNLSSSKLWAFKIGHNQDIFLALPNPFKAKKSRIRGNVSTPTHLQNTMSHLLYGLYFQPCI